MTADTPLAWASRTPPTKADDPNLPLLPTSAVYVIHLEDPPNSGLAACCGLPFELPRGSYAKPMWLCTGCSNAALRGRR